MLALLMNFRFRWHTDTHLNFASNRAVREFIASIRDDEPDALLLTGDISDGLRIERHLDQIASSLECPVYFVLGNHDCYFHGFPEIIRRIQGVVKANPNLMWLTDSGPIALSQEIALVGTEGWYDALVGDKKSVFWCGLGDWMCIPELSRAFVTGNGIDVICELSKFYATIMRQQLFEAIKRGFKKIIVATHVPPWRDDERSLESFMGSFWSAYDTSVLMGNAIEIVAAMFPDVEFVVFAGHIHYHRQCVIAHNVRLMVRDSGLKNFGELTLSALF